MPMSGPAIEAKIKAALPDAEVLLEDLTGGQDHWKAKVVSASFEGASPVKRHRLIYAALKEEMKGPIHALALETLTPDEAIAAAN